MANEKKARMRIWTEEYIKTGCVDRADQALAAFSERFCGAVEKRCWWVSTGPHTYSRECCQGSASGRIENFGTHCDECGGRITLVGGG